MAGVRREEAPGDHKSHCFGEPTLFIPVGRNDKCMRKSGLWRGARTGASGVLFLAARLTLFVLWLGYLQVWMHWTSWGFLIAIATSPGIVVFPLMYWIVEGRFPTGYFIIWAVATILLVLSFVAGPRSDGIIPQPPESR